MSVEGGSGGGVSVAGAASVSGAAIFGMPSLEAAPVMVNEGPVRSLEGFRPMNISDINPTQPLVITQAEEVAAKAWNAGEPLDSQVTTFPNVIPANAGIQLKIQSEERLLDPALRRDDRNAMIVPQVEPAPALQVSPAIAPQPVPLEQEIEEVVLEKVKVEEPKDELEEEEIEEFRLKDLLDEQVSEQRVHDIGKAIDSAGEEAAKEGVSGIEGWRVAKFIRLFMHIGLLSQIAKRLGRDGSLDETVEELAAGQFENEDQAKKQSREIVSWNEPVKTGINGTPVREGAVAKVLKYQPVQGSPSEQVVLRVEKRRKVQVKGQESVQLGSVVTSEVRETSLADYPDLEEVFGKAT